MSKSSAKPYDQTRRIALLRVTSALVLLPLILLTRPLWEAGWPRDITRLIGTLLIVIGVLGRFWAILYIGSCKNKEVMQDGPYSVCRHPLYLSSTLGVAGFGFLLGSFVIAAVMTAAIFAILSRTASREEAFLRAEFGPAYDEYARKVPRILPRLGLFHTNSEISVQIGPLRTNCQDALVFLTFLPLAMVIGWIRDAGLLPMLILP